MNIVTFVMSEYYYASNLRPNVFLVIQDRQAYLINWLPWQGRPGDLCPCCFSKDQVAKIQNSVQSAVDEHLIDGKVRWSSPEGARLGDDLGRFGFKHELFCSGSPDPDISDEMKKQIQVEAIRQILQGIIPLSLEEKVAVYEEVVKELFNTN